MGTESCVIKEGGHCTKLGPLNLTLFLFLYASKTNLLFLWVSENLKSQKLKFKDEKIIKRTDKYFYDFILHKKI